MIVRRLACCARGLVLAFAALSIVADCSGQYVSAEHSQNITQKSNFTWNAKAYNTVYGTQFESLEQAYTVVIKVGSQTLLAPTHLFGAEINVIPYSNDDGTMAADGHLFERGDSEIAKVFKAGDLGIAIKHHCSEYPTLDLNRANPHRIMKHVNLLDTHVEIVIGVEREGMPGAITINNPQTYEGGYFGDETYAMVFLRPVYPDYLCADQVKAFVANTRTMLVGFNAVTQFPSNYRRDPLGARNPRAPCKSTSGIWSSPSMATGTRVLTSRIQPTGSTARARVYRVLGRPTVSAERYDDDPTGRRSGLEQVQEPH